VDGHLQRVEHALGGVVVGHNPLRNDDRFGGNAHRLGVETEVDDQLLRRAGDAAEVGVGRDGACVIDFDASSWLVVGA